MRRTVVTAVARYALGLVGFSVFVALPFVTKKRDTPAEVPSPPPLFVTDLVLVNPGSRLCMTDLALSAQSEQMRFRVGSYHRPGPPLRVTIKAAGYSAATSIPGGW